MAEDLLLHLDVPRDLADRAARIASARRRSSKPGGEPADVLGEALARGVLMLELEQARLERESEIERLDLDTRPIPEDEAQRAFARETGDVSFGTRRNDDDRRAFVRTDTTGRRTEDHERARRAFVRKVLALLDAGHADAEVADRMNAGGYTTSRGKPWTAAAIAQLANLERAKQTRQNAWQPRSLDK